MSIDQDLETISRQEKRLQFRHFDSEAAWAIGTALKAAAEKRKVSVAIDVQLHGMPLFSYAMAGITPDNWDWIRRKRNVVTRYQRSSYAIGLKYEREKTILACPSFHTRWRELRRTTGTGFGGSGTW